MKRILISTVVSKWIEVEDDAGDWSLSEIDGLYDGIDLNQYEATDFEIVEEEEA